jgi:enamine deaminase RidA (YjgF/YER057c/UK114 family)
VNQEIAPADIAPPAANYAHAVMTERAGTWLHTSGVVPTRPDQSVPDDVGEQAATVWANLLAILQDADMGPSDVVSIITYVVVDQLSSLPVIMAARDRALSGRRVASTLLTVPALANPAWKLEISLIAAR